MSSVTSVYARTVDEIESEIEQKQKELDNLEDALAESRSQIDYYNSQQDKSSSEVEKTQLELELTKSELLVNEATKNELSEKLSLKQLEVEKYELLIGEKLAQLYKYDRQNGMFDLFLENGQVSEFWKEVKYRESLVGIDIDALNTLGEEYETILEEKKNVDRSLALLEEDHEKLRQKVTDLENLINSLQANIAYNTDQITQLEMQVEGVKQGIEGLTAEQQAIVAQESEQLNEGSGDPEPLTKGEYYFLGTGRDLYDGHGVGMSQYGAYGMAQNFGWNAYDILKYYYTGVVIDQYPQKADISIVYCPDNRTYDTPPCSGNPAVTARISFDDYLTGIGEMPDDWPKEAVKAQIIAARTYAIRYTDNGNPSKPICITASCQVHYLNTEKKRQAVNETKNLVITSNGNLISAVYHASSRGYTQNNEYQWTKKAYSNTSAEDLLGWPSTYLRGIDDSEFSYKNDYYNWKWRTNSYSLQELSSIFSLDPETNIGTISHIELYRKFNRVWAVKLVGTRGTRYIAGWKFKAVFNSWIFAHYPPEKRVFIYSTDFNFIQV